MVAKKKKGSQPSEIWEWADGIIDPPYDPSSPQIIPHTAARRGRKLFEIGDTVQIKGSSSSKWVGLIREFAMDYTLEEFPMQVIVIWFCGPQHIKAAKRRKEGHAVCSFLLLADVG
jgi:hypothetical protein